MSEYVERLTDVKPCPFCGGGEMWLTEFRPRMWFIVTCSGCVAEIGGRCREQAIEKWNRRADES